VPVPGKVVQELLTRYLAVYEALIYVEPPNLVRHVPVAVRVYYDPDYARAGPVRAYEK
jgi:hypothetical protein